MKNSETEREVINLIVSTLEKHEEHYILGSWENFARTRARRRRFYLWFSITGLAASIMIGWMGYRMFFPGHVATTISVQTTLTPEQGIKRESRHDESTGNIPATGDAVKIKQFEAEPAGNVNNKQFENTPPERVYISSIAGTEYHHIILTNTDIIDIPPSADNIISAGNVSPGKLIAEEDVSDNPVARSKKVRFGVNVSPGVTSTTTASSFNYAGGVNAEIEIARNLRLSTGLQIEHQSAVTMATDNPSWIPAGQSQAILTDLDLPVNITWKFKSGKSSGYYITSGLSSVAYLSEKYISTSYTQKVVETMSSVGGTPSVSYQIENVKNTSQRTEQPLNSINLAGRVNIIFGFEQHLSSKLFIHIEPFLKIPVTGQASENLRFTTSGVACKISF